jgi:hypothetical protein
VAVLVWSPGAARTPQRFQRWLDAGLARCSEPACSAEYMTGSLAAFKLLDSFEAVA